MVEQGSGASTELQELLRSVWRRKFVVSAVIGVILVATIAMTARQVKLYEASAQVVVVLSESAQVVDPTSEGRLQYERDLANELEFIRSDALRSAIAEELGFVPDLRVSAGDGDQFKFSIRGASPDRLASVANASAEIYVRERNERIVQEYLDTIGSVQRQIAALEAEEDEILAPITEFRASLDPFAVNTLGDLINSEVEISEYQQQLRQLEADAAASLDLLAASRAQLRRTQDELQLSSNLQNGSARISRRAPAPVNPVSPNWATNLILGSIGAIMAGLAAGLTLEYLDKRIQSARDLRNIVGDRYQMITIPTAPRAGGRRSRADARLPGADLILESMPDSDTAQALWELNGLMHYTRLNEHQEIERCRVIVTSAEPQAGKTFVASNLALTTARSGGDTMLVDLDLRRPRVHSMFDLPNQSGAAALLEGEEVHPERFGENLRIQVAGRLRGNPVELAARSEQTGIPEAWTDADLLVFDTPPLLAAPEAAMWASLCDILILVVRSGQTKRSDFEQALNKIQMLDLEVLLVVTDQKAAHSDYKYANAYQPVETKSRWRRSGQPA